MEKNKIYGVIGVKGEKAHSQKNSSPPQTPWKY